MVNDVQYIRGTHPIHIVVMIADWPGVNPQCISIVIKIAPWSLVNFTKTATGDIRAVITHPLRGDISDQQTNIKFVISYTKPISPEQTLSDKISLGLNRGSSHGKDISDEKGGKFYLPPYKNRNKISCSYKKFKGLKIRHWPSVLRVYWTQFKYKKFTSGLSSFLN